jgi:hypothetical protein
VREFSRTRFFVSCAGRQNSSMRKFTGFLFLSSVMLVGCGGSGSSVTTAVGGTLASYQVLDQVGYSFDPVSKVGVCTTGMISFAQNSIRYRATPGAPLTALSGAGGFTSHSEFRDGKVVGTQSTVLGGAVVGSTPKYWSSITAAPINLRFPAPFTNCSAQSVNRSGVIVGTASVAGTGATAVFWSTPTSVAVALPGTGRPIITNSGHILYTGDGTVSLAPNTTTAPVALAVPAGFAELTRVVLSDNGEVFVKAYQSASSKVMRPYRVNLATGALTPMPTVPSNSFELICAANGWQGGADRLNDRPILVRGSTVQYVDDLITEATGEVFTEVLAIFSDGSLMLEGTKNGTLSHFYIPPGMLPN